MSQDLIRIGRQPDRLPAHLSPSSERKKLGKQSDVVPPLPQRRQPDANNIDSVKQIATKAAVLNHCIDISGRGGDNPDVDRGLLAGANPANPPLLQHPQQFGLQGRRQFSYLVEEQCPPVSHLNQADAAGISSSEGSPLMAKQFAFE
jgi:hypothetical protein